MRLGLPASPRSQYHQPPTESTMYTNCRAMSAYSRASRKRATKKRLFAIPTGHVQTDARTTSQTLIAPDAKPRDSNSENGSHPMTEHGTREIADRQMSESARWLSGERRFTVALLSCCFGSLLVWSRRAIRNPAFTWFSPLSLKHHPFKVDPSSVRSSRALADSTPEDDAANTCRAAPPRDLTRRLAARSRGVDGSFAGDHELVGSRFEFEQVEQERRSRQQLGPERGERGAEAAGRPGARHVGIRGEAAEACLELG